MGKLLVPMIVVALVAIICSLVYADPDNLQDICVADKTSAVKVNGFPCKSSFNATDFFSDAISKPGLTNNTYGSKVTSANVDQIPGLNTFGVSLARIDYAPGGINPPHTHPRATEVVFVLEGELEVGFITTANILITKNITKGDVFAFPKGLVHFQKNNNKDNSASVISAFNSQLPGTQSIALTLFTATPAVPDHVLGQAFQIGTKQVEKMRTRLTPKK